MPSADPRDGIVHRLAGLVNEGFTKQWTAFLANPVFLRDGPVRAVTAQQIVGEFGRDVARFAVDVEVEGTALGLSLVFDAAQMKPLLAHLMLDEEYEYSGFPTTREVEALTGLVAQGLKSVCRRIRTEDRIEILPGEVTFEHVPEEGLGGLAARIDDGLCRVAQSDFEVFGHSGSVMIIVLPMRLVELLNELYSRSFSRTDILGWCPTPESTLRVVVADGSETNLLRIQEALSPHKVVVLTARDGEEAMRRIEKNGADLVICDPGLPRVDGPNLARWLRSRSATASVPVAFCGSMPRRETLLDHVRAGMNEFLVRPPDPLKIRGLLEKYLPEAVV